MTRIQQGTDSIVVSREGDKVYITIAKSVGIDNFKLVTIKLTYEQWKALTETQ